MTGIEGGRLNGPVMLGSITALVLVFGLGLWASTVPIDGAVLATGEIDSTPQRHLVQHPTGGVIAEVAVREGQMVSPGDLLVRLDGGSLEQEWALISAQLIEAQARKLRLTAERDAAPFGPDLSEITEDPEERLAVIAQRRLFDARQTTLARQIQQLDQRKLQIEAQLFGLAAQDLSMLREADLVAQELATLVDLRRQGLTPESRVLALDRQAARIEGSRAALMARVAELHGQEAEIALQVETLRAERREEAETQLLELNWHMVELVARRALLAERRTALMLRAPAAGLVHGLASLGAGAVLRPAEAAMQVVIPVTRPVLALQIRPADIDHVRLNQSAVVQFPALVRDVRDLAATVTAISAAPFEDERTGARHYRVEAALTAEAIAIVGEDALRPGMAVQAYLTTGRRTPIDYLLSPVTAHIRRAMRDP